MNNLEKQIDGSRPASEGAGRYRQSMTHRTLSGMFWAFSSGSLQNVLRLVVLVVLTRLLTPAEFGLVSAALVVVGFTELFSQLGMGPAVVQRPQLEARHLRTGMTVSISLGLLLCALLWLIAPSIAAFFRQETLTPVLRVLAFVFPLSSISVVAESLARRELRFRDLAAVQVISYAVGYGVVGIGLACLQCGVWALVGARLGQEFVNCVLVLRLQPHPKRPQLERLAFRELMSFGGGFTAARIGNYAALNGDNLVVGRWLGVEALGLYSRAYQLLVMPASLIGQVFDSVLFPTMAKVQHDPERLTVAYRRCLSAVALIILPASIVMYILAPQIIGVLFGAKWSGVIVPFQILSLGMLFRTSYKISDSLARAMGAVYRRAWRQLIYAALVIGGALIGQFWGIVGVSVGVAVAITINFLLMAHLSLSLLGIGWRHLWAAYVPALMLTTTLGAELWALTRLLSHTGLQPLWVLSTTLPLAASTGFLLVRLSPRLFLGQDGVWMMQVVQRYIPKRLNPFLGPRRTQAPSFVRPGVNES